MKMDGVPRQTEVLVVYEEGYVRIVSPSGFEIELDNEDILGIAHTLTYREGNDDRG